ncbi:MAG: GntR family transcriptional regulator [Rhizobiales bacterium]|nr:GntR family transcriptional regulator [Hyphomicrobiales bacterium]
MKTGLQVSPCEGRVSRVEATYLALKLLICNGEFPPGHQVSEQELALRLGTSRTPVHEACLRLQEDGMLRILPKKGIVISPLSPDDIAEIFEVIIAIEGRAAALAASRPAEARAVLADQLDAETMRMQTALAAGDMAERGLADAAFHLALVEGCGNRRFERIMQTVNDQYHRARVITVRMRQRLEQSLPEHREIAAAIRAGSVEQAETAARVHRIRARNDILPLIRDLGLRHL